MTGHDQQAAGLLQVLSRAGVAIPGRISVTGFGDGWPARLSSVDLTTARQDPERMGTAAVRGAVRRIDQPALPPSVSVVEPWPVVRGSTARPPAADAAGPFPVVKRANTGQIIYI